jgi:hypothetical protein
MLSALENCSRAIAITCRAFGTDRPIVPVIRFEMEADIVSREVRAGRSRSI